jgi:hypothetical protein
MKSKIWQSGKITYHSFENFVKKQFANFSKLIVHLPKKCPTYKIGEVPLAPEAHKLDISKFCFPNRNSEIKKGLQMYQNTPLVK